jgi:hypothetical protein
LVRVGDRGKYRRQLPVEPTEVLRRNPYDARRREQQE